MTALDVKFPQELRERYLASLSPIERMDYELACAREKRMVAERAQERRETEALLLRIEEAEGCGSEPAFLLSWEEFRLLRRELRRLKGNPA